MIKQKTFSQSYVIIAFLMLFFLNNSLAQVRPDINSFTPAQRNMLVNLMQQYITPEIVGFHCNYDPDGDDIPMIHSDFDFLPFHRLYIQGMEDYLVLQGHPEFVPLPKWNPTGCVPSEFQIVDADCASLTQNTCHNGWTGVACSVSIDWCPGNTLPTILSLPIQAGGNNDICDWPMDPTEPIPGIDVCCTGGLSNHIESPYHNSVHGRMGGIMADFRSPVVPMFFLWHAFVDDLWKSWEQNCPQSTTKSVDLWMADNHKLITSDRDRGEEPDIDNGHMWESEDIWVRNQPDGKANQLNENPILTPGGTIFIYVRVRNRGYQSSLGDGTEKLQLHWAKAGTSLTWKDNWDGSTDFDPPNKLLAGNIIPYNGQPTQTIPLIVAGGQKILEFAWTDFPNPSDYSAIGNTEPLHFCLLARILATNDPMHTDEGPDVNFNTKQNNNIVWKNITVIDNIPGMPPPPNGEECNKDIMQGIGAAVDVANPYNRTEKFDIIFTAPSEELGTSVTGVRKTTENIFGVIQPINTVAPAPQPANPITDNGNVIVALDKQLYERWVQGGRKSTGVTEIKGTNMSNTGILNNNINYHSPIDITNRKIFEITGTASSFNNITLDAKEFHTTSLMVLYPTNPISNKQQFKYDIIQKESNTGKIIGGVRYDIKKPTNTDVVTDAGEDRTIGRGCTTTLTAAPQKNCYSYFWLDGLGNIISKESTVIVSPLVTTTYTLKIVSSTGFISDDKVTVIADKNNNAIACGPVPTPPGCFSDVTVSPNPAGNNDLHVQFSAEERTSFNISLTDIKGKVLVQDNTVVGPGPIERILPLNKVPVGVYKMIIKCKTKSQEISVSKF